MLLGLGDQQLFLSLEETSTMRFSQYPFWVMPIHWVPKKYYWDSEII